VLPPARPAETPLDSGTPVSTSRPISAFGNSL
jgi:hypothetical protein